MKKGFCIAGIIVGVIMIIIGLAGAGLDANFNGSYPDSATFGADFYTYIYGATHDAASNVASLGYFMMTAMKAVAGLLGRFIAAFGAVVVCFFGYKFAEIKENEPEKAATEESSESSEKAEETVAEETAEAVNESVEETVEEAEAVADDVAAETVEEAEAVADDVAAETAETAPVMEEAAEETAEKAVETVETVETADKEI